MYRARWQQLIANRNSLPFVEVATWNDYGESHYIGPMTGLAPKGATYVTRKSSNCNSDLELPLIRDYYSPKRSSR